MSKYSQTQRDNLPILGSETSIQRKKAKSTTNITMKTPDKNPERKNTSTPTHVIETQQTNSKNPTRNLHFSFGTSKDTNKKNYMKNSDKTIKPPEKLLKTRQKSLIPTRQKTMTTMVRAGTIIKSENNNKENATLLHPIVAKRSLTFDNLKTDKVSTPTTRYPRIDNKSIDELEKRLEQLQTIFINKLELLKSREPNKLRKTYKLVAMLVDDEAKLVVKDSDAQRLPNKIPAKSVEDLHIKIGKFFTGCLLAFTDKLRLYQREKRQINCDEIYKELKNEEKDFCAILKDWVLEMCDDHDATLTPDSFLTNEHERETKEMCEFGIQTDVELSEHFNKSSNEFADIVNLHVELNEVKQQLSKKDDNYLAEIIRLKDQFELKINELKKSLLVEQNINSSKNEEIFKVQKRNEDLSQQLEERMQQIDALTKQNDELNLKLQDESQITQELRKVREELETIRRENQELLEIKTNFLRKLNVRSKRIDTLERELKEQKSKMNLRNKEIEDVKKEFEAKIKENCDYKESLNARNILIDHLRKAIDIEQRKRREYEAKCEANISNLKKSKEEEQFSNGVQFTVETLDTKHSHHNFMNFYDKEKSTIRKTTKERILEKSPIVVEENPFMLSIPKDDTSSSEEIIAVNDRFLNRKRKSRTIVVKKYDV